MGLQTFMPNLAGAAKKFFFGTDFQIDTTSGAIQIKDSAGNLVPISVADGTGLAQVATVRQLRENAGLAVSGQIDGNTPPDPAVNDGSLFVVTTAGGSFALRELYVSRGGAWTALTLDDGLLVTVADDLAGGAITFAGGHVHVYDSQTDTWVDNGKTTSLAGAIRASQADVAFDAASPVTAHDATPGDIHRVHIRVLTAFDDPAAALGTLQDGSASDVIDPATLAAIDLTQTGETSVAVSQDANSDLTLALSPGAATAGQVQVITEYRTA